MWHLFAKKSEMITSDQALPGRETAIGVTEKHCVTGNPMSSPWLPPMERAMFGMGCFWGAERKFWQQSGVYSTQVGYAGGFTRNPTYEEVCSGKTGHNEVVRVIFNPRVITYQQLLKVFWEVHNPTQGMKQGNDVGTQYRSGIYTYSQQQINLAKESQNEIANQLKKFGYGTITTEILDVPTFYYAEDYHQQYLHKNPNGYCGLRGTGVVCSV